MPGRKTPSVEVLTERFYDKLDRSGECWLWTAACYSSGYGAFRVGPKQMRTHRWAYETFVEPIPEGAIVMHTCDVRRCVNPEHLRVGTHLENQQDMTRKGRGRIGVRNGWVKHAPKLTLAKANEIRTRYAAGNVTQTALSIEYGVVGQFESARDLADLESRQGVRFGSGAPTERPCRVHEREPSSCRAVLAGHRCAPSGQAGA